MIHTPAKAVLTRYGLTPALWAAILKRQRGHCPICKRALVSIRVTEESDGESKVAIKNNYVVDHEHRRGFRRLPASERAKYVRGILCRYCNKQFLPRGMTIDIASSVLEYLRQYKTRLHVG